MDIRALSGTIESVQADTIIINLFEGQTPGGATAAMDRALSGQIGSLVTAGDIKGKPGEITVLYNAGAGPAQRVIIAGLGKPQDFTPDKVRQAVAGAVRKARELGARSIATIAFGAGAGSLDAQTAAQITVESAVLALYDFRVHKSGPADNNKIQSLALVEADSSHLADVQTGAQVGEILAQAANLARDLVNQPSNHMTPRLLAQAACQVAEQYNLQCQVLAPEHMAELGMGALMGVTRGSDEPAQFIILEHRPAAGQPIVLVGKGITFDSGGISIKPAERMGDMKGDMAGAAAVIAAMQAVARLDLPLHVVGLAPACENLPSGHALKPGDVLRAMNGKTIEIISTDAEGRLILADALSYAARYNPLAVIDLATLTGACVVALGASVAAGLFANDDKLAADLTVAGARAGEKLWRLPLYDEYKDKIRSEVADMKNSGGRQGGVGTSAMLLKEFTTYPWAHLDIAGMALNEKGVATGFGVRTLVEYLRRRLAG